MSKIVAFISYDSVPELMRYGHFCFSSSPENPDEFMQIIERAIEEDRLIASALSRATSALDRHEGRQAGITLFLIEAANDLLLSETLFLAEKLSLGELEANRAVSYVVAEDTLEEFWREAREALREAQRELQNALPFA